MNRSELRNDIIKWAAENRARLLDVMSVEDAIDFIYGGASYRPANRTWVLGYYKGSSIPKVIQYKHGAWFGDDDYRVETPLRWLPLPPNDITNN